MTRPILLVLAVLFATLAACTPSRLPKSEIANSGNDEVESDLSCSYFYFLWGSHAEVGGRYAEARQSLQDASRDEKVGAEAKFWLAAAYHRLGEGREAQALLAEMEKQSAGIRKSYQELLILPPIF